MFDPKKRFLSENGIKSKFTREDRMQRDAQDCADEKLLKFKATDLQVLKHGFTIFLQRI